MGNEMLELLTRLKEQSEKRRSYNEDQAKQGIVLPILRQLGWDTEDVEEVHPEFSIEQDRIDYALVLEGRPAVFIEAKRPSEDLDNESHEEQLLGYSFRQTVDLAILTNGLTWSFYLPREGGDWRSRKFYTLDITQQHVKDASSRLTELLSKSNIASREALESAKRIFRGKVRKDRIRETLPKAWNKIVLEPDSLLAELLAETTERLCGFKPDEEEAAEFIRQYRDRLKLTPSIPKVVQPPKGGNKGQPRPSNEKGRKGFELVKDYLIPVIRFMKEEDRSHAEAFRLVADNLGVKRNTVQDRCTRGLDIPFTDEFSSLVQSGEIIQRAKKKRPQQIELIERELKPLYP
ncbi:MAG: type I restriction endonuclease [Gemmatimonadota bacterium]|nr:type I restriction endonuclease [Gemmatimonadota bacterium]